MPRLLPPHRVLSALAVTTTVVAALIVAPGSAGAATARPWGHISRTVQHRDGTVTVTGYTVDLRHPGRAQPVCLATAGRCVRVVRPHLPSPRFDRLHHIHGAHRFRVTTRPLHAGLRLVMLTHPGTRVLDATHVASPGTRVVDVARRYVGDRYVYGGSSPRSGFDCSGYALYSYRRARVAALPHNSESQRHARHMHRISRAQALPGDLVFYSSGGPAYHVAIYAGHGMQYSASTPQTGVRYERITSGNIEFRTDWH